MEGLSSYNTNILLISSQHVLAHRGHHQFILEENTNFVGMRINYNICLEVC
jgi:hypothetical protein